MNLENDHPRAQSMHSPAWEEHRVACRDFHAVKTFRNRPLFNLGFNGTRCTTNPLGVKGCGEAGAIAAFPAVANAIADALAPLSVADLVGPAARSRSGAG